MVDGVPEEAFHEQELGHLKPSQSLVIQIQLV